VGYFIEECEAVESHIV